MNHYRGNQLFEAGLANTIMLVRLYISNTDLPDCFLVRASINEDNWSTVYASGSLGCTDYPFLNPQFQ